MTKDDFYETVILCAIFAPLLWGILRGKDGWFWQAFAWMVGIQ